MYKSQPPYYGLHPPYAAVCYFGRLAGRPDKGNCLESGDVISHDQPSVYTHIMQKASTALNN